jgi:uncharacterized membrane protein
VDDVAAARALHVLAVVLWIGGVGLVTTALLPALRRLPDPVQRIAAFEAVERRFGRQTRLYVLLAGLSGLYMLARLDAWYRFASPSYWWMHAMVLVWLIFAAMLFVLEPLVLHRRLAARARAEPEATFRTLQRFHAALLAPGLITILGAVRAAAGRCSGERRRGGRARVRGPARAGKPFGQADTRRRLTWPRRSAIRPSRW